MKINNDVEMKEHKVSPVLLSHKAGALVSRYEPGVVGGTCRRIKIVPQNNNNDNNNSKRQQPEKPAVWRDRSRAVGGVAVGGPEGDQERDSGTVSVSPKVTQVTGVGAAGKSASHKTADLTPPPASCVHFLQQANCSAYLAIQQKIFKPERQPQASEKLMLISLEFNLRFWITADGGISKR